MPDLSRTLLVAITAFLCCGGASPGQDAVGVRVIRSNQNAFLSAVTVNFGIEPRDFVVRATEDLEPGWVVFYLLDGFLNVTPQVTSPEGLTLSVPPFPEGIEILVAFFPVNAAEGSIKTTTITATPSDGDGPPQVGEFRIRLLDTLVVNDARDLGEVDVDDEFIDVDPVQPGEQTTLRAAIEFCNARAGLDAIHFNLPGPDLPRILPLTPLPPISDPVVIDGSSQSTVGPVGIEISGEALTAANSSDGLIVTGGGSTLRGLAITRFRSENFGAIPSPLAPNPSGIVLTGNGGNTIESCLVGLHPDGTVGAGNEGYGIRVESSLNTITACHLSGNWVGGIGLIGPGATENQITAVVGGDLGTTHSTNFPDLPLMVEGVSLAPLGGAPDFASLDRNLANASVHFVNRREIADWESGPAGFLGGIVLYDAPRNILRSCSVQGNGADGIRLIGSCQGTEVRECTVGQAANADPSLRNAGHGIALTTDTVRLVSCKASGNSQSGVLVRGTNNVLEGLIASRNAWHGVQCEGANTTIGGTTFQARGQFFSNGRAGIFLTAPTVPVPYPPGANRIVGNLIGIESPFGSGQYLERPNLRGVQIDRSDRNAIGASTLPGAANTIAYNHREGILVAHARSNVLYGNIAVLNRGLDLDLTATDQGDGLDLPDPGDLDAGGNDKTNAPQLIDVIQTAAGLRIRGSVQTATPGSFLLEFVFLLPGQPLATAQFLSTHNLAVSPPLQPFSVLLPFEDSLLGAYFRAALTDPDLNGSEFTSWVRIEGPTQSDSDLVSDELESLVPSRDSGAPSPGDGNGDGLPDAGQDNVASLPLLHRGFLTLAAPPGRRLTQVLATATPTARAAPTLTFPAGTWDFALASLDAGAATVTVFLTGHAIADTYFNFGPTPERPEPHWYEFLFDGATGAEILADRIVLHFVDGRRGDHDLVVNGMIRTGGGMANALSAVPDPAFTHLADGSLLISWDRAAAGLLLEESAASDPGFWQFTPEPVFETASSFAVRVLPDRGTELFRLIRP